MWTFLAGALPVLGASQISKIPGKFLIPDDIADDSIIADPRSE